MSKAVEPISINETDDPLARVRVTMKDATGAERVYEISLGPDTLGTKYLMGGRRVDDDAPDEPAGGGPSRGAWNAAREHFESEGYDVYGEKKR